MRRLTSYRSNERGDTIIEVMLAIAVVGMVLAAAYNIANRALMTGRYAQEQTEALKVAESQVEKLKYKASLFKQGDSIGGTIFDTAAGTTSFCIADDSNLSKVTVAASNYATDCALRSGLYTPKADYDAANNLFTVTVSWESPLVTNAKVEVAYKLYQ